VPQGKKRETRNRKQQKGRRERSVEKKEKKMWMNVRTGRWDEVPYNFRVTPEIFTPQDLAPKWMV
jgi:hypothetical protein